jgi:hypothetical protein
LPRGSSVRIRFSRPEWTILLAFLLAAPLLLTFWVNGDGIGYAAYLHSAVIDGDLDLSNEFEYLSTHIEADSYGLPSLFLRRSSHRVGIDPIWHTPLPDPVTGRVPSYFSVGPAMAWTPAYLVAHGLAVAASATGLTQKPSGYGGLYYLAIILTSFGFGIAGLLMAYRFASAAVAPRQAMWAALAIGWATPLVYYLYLSASYGHALTAFTSAAFLLYWWHTRGVDRPATWFRWGLLAGLLFLIRWNDVVIAVPAFALESFRALSRNGPGGGGARVSRLLTGLGAAAAGFFIVAAPQLGVWQYFHGRPWVRHPVELVGFDPGAAWKILLSSRHGLFIWSPVTVPAVAGLLSLFRRNRELAGVSIAALALLVISNGLVHDWWGGSSFGMRRLVSATPLFALGLGVFMDDVGGAWTRLLARGEAGPRGALRASLAGFAAPLLAIAFSIWNLLLMAQYSLRMISHTEAVSFAAMAANQPRVVARLIQLAAATLK